MVTKEAFYIVNTYFFNRMILLHFDVYYKIQELHSLFKIKFYRISKYVFLIT